VPRVDFFFLKSHFACRLTEKAFKKGHSVYLFTPSTEETELLNDLLWSFREDSFVPHQIFGQSSAVSQLTIEIGHREDIAPNFDLLINLTNKIPTFFNQFHRVSEVVVQQEAVLDATRNSYKQYKEQGCPLHLHNIQSV
jgi:DNA polymerase-3 subunit chi